MGVQQGRELLNQKRAKDTADYQNVWGKRRKGQTAVNPVPVERALPGNRKGTKRVIKPEQYAELSDIDQRVKDHLAAPRVNDGNWIAVDPEKSYLRKRLFPTD